jgi:orotidine-5'-phosphate decarboxylase
VALDVPDTRRAGGSSGSGDSVTFYKVGLELFMAGNYWELVAWLTGQGKKVFADLKFFDVPETVRSAVRRLHGRGVSFTTVHGNDAIMRAAVEARGEVKILAVTVLTSLDQATWPTSVFSCNVADLVLRARAGRWRSAATGHLLRPRGAAAARAPRREVPRRDSRHPPGAQPPGRRPEADGRHRGGLPRRRGLHRRRAPDPHGAAAALAEIYACRRSCSFFLICEHAEAGNSTQSVLSLPKWAALRRMTRGSEEVAPQSRA